MKRFSKEEWIISCLVMTCVFSMVFFMYCSWILFSLNRTIPEMERDLIEIKTETEQIRHTEERNADANNRILHTLEENDP